MKTVQDKPAGLTTRNAAPGAVLAGHPEGGWDRAGERGDQDVSLTDVLRPKSDRVRFGADTVAVAFRGKAAGNFIDHLLTLPGTPAARGGWMLSEKDRSGARVMCWPGYSMVKVEGRAAALAYADDRCHELLDSTSLAAIPELARAAITRTAKASLGDDCQAGSSRLDLVTERTFDDLDEGKNFLRAVSLLLPPGRLKRSVYLENDGRVQTAYVVTERGQVRFRAYDKDYESKAGPPGRRIRFEQQNRFRKDSARTFDELASGDLRRFATRTWAGYAEATMEAVVGKTEAMKDVLFARAAAGEISEAKAERLAGTLDVLRRYGRAFYADDRKARRRLEELRKVGIAVDDDLAPDQVMPVGALLREMLDSVPAGGCS
jgi:hypothetical protein